MFYQLVGGAGEVGIWHETYQVNPGQFETFYANMPRLGLGEVMGLVPAAGRRNAARERLQAPEPVTA